MKLERILLPIDFSELTVRAADIACSLAQATGATVHLIHVCQPVEVALEAPEIGVLLRKMPPDEVVLKKMLDEFAKKHLGDFGVSVLTALGYGKPARAIARYAREAHIDRIIMATHAGGLLRRILRGSVSQYVLEHAPCPVVMVPPLGIATRRDSRGARGIPAAATA